MVLAGHPYEEGIVNMWEFDYSALDTFAKAALALSLHDIGRTRQAQEIVDELASDASVLPTGKVFWGGASQDGTYYQKTMASDTRTTAMVLSAFTRISPNHELEAGMVRWLMGERRQQGWGTTNETSFAILALTDHLVRAGFGEENAGNSYSIELNGEPYQTGTLGRTTPFVTLEIPADELLRGENSLRLRHQSDGTLYYVVNQRVYVAQTEIERAGIIRVTRTYFDIESGNAITTAVAGQLVGVALQVDMPSRGSFIIVEDSLLGGVEAINEGLDNSTHVVDAYGNPRSRYDSWRETGYNHKEIRDDKVSFFISDLERGGHRYVYFVRVVNAGIFTAMPTEVYAMYDLTTWGRSASSNFQIVE
jgi:uncharacterized protein YfaS (alpha-2-macroglobulin family)